MAKRSDFTQKLIDDLRLRKERMGLVSPGSQRSPSPTTTTAKTRHQSSSPEGVSQQITPFRGRQQHRLDLSMALSNSGKLQSVEILGNNTMGSKIVLHLDANMNVIIRAYSNPNGLGFRRDSIHIGRELLKGAVDLEESLKMLVTLQDASDYMVSPQRKHKRFELLDGNEEDESSKGSSSSQARSISYGTKGSTTYQRMRIPNVVAKLMGLEEIPMPTDANPTKKKKISTQVINKEVRAGREASTVHRRQQSREAIDDNSLKARVLGSNHGKVEEGLVLKRQKDKGFASKRILSTKERSNSSKSSILNNIGTKASQQNLQSSSNGKMNTRNKSITNRHGDKKPMEERPESNSPASKHKVIRNRKTKQTEAAAQKTGAPKGREEDAIRGTLVMAASQLKEQKSSVKQELVCRLKEGNKIPEAGKGSNGEEDQEEELREDEVALKHILTKNHNFLDIAREIFQIKIPFPTLKADQTVNTDKDTRLVIDCANEVIRRKGMREGRRRPFSPSRMRSLNLLIREVNGDLQSLRCLKSSKGCGNDLADGLSRMIEKDIQQRNPDINASWDFDWIGITFACMEKNAIVQDVEKHVLNGLLNELVAEFINVKKQHKVKKEK